jgi:hypothetical protein
MSFAFLSDTVEWPTGRRLAQAHIGEWPLRTHPLCGLAPEKWKPDFQYAFTVAFLLKVSHSRVRQIPEGHHPRQPAAFVFHDRKPRQTCFRHAHNHRTQ